MSDPKTLAKTYFEAWRTHDLTALGRIFDPGARYVILNKQTTFDGLEEISRYWIRNKARQRQLRVSYVAKEKNVAGDVIDLVFAAEFIDIIERERQDIIGDMTIKVSDGFIGEITETYWKGAEELQAQQGALSAGQLYRRFQVWAWIKWYWLRGQKDNIIGWLLGSGAVISTILAIALGVTAFTFGTWPDWLVGLIALSPLGGPFSEDDRLLAEKAASRNMLMFSAIYFVLLPLIYYLRSSRLRLFEIVGLNVPAHDLELMKRSYAGAKEVTIFSGDFSFLAEDNHLLEELQFLARKERLILVSHRSRETVIESVKLHHEARSLIEGLIQANRIRFESGLGVHCSVVHKWDHREVLYRYLSPERNRVSDYNMCILVGRREARPILDAIEMVRGRWAQFGTQ